ncbi:hypothetical protein [Paenibacillus methanolicus]|uniref:Uncharacterized protein n=1 Tax=Paenibacillus methanolicus TaxID=582686 RepID=A0A5S5CH16_9BACL|nr:hypothetical protein [Paenibacillus methanolicus]TYP77630.1 hypothetical protein BCM02_102191 [Paenibacillus methanolicus]
MIGTWRWNAALGIIGGLLTMLASMGGNGLLISAVRCVYAFVAFFVLGFLFRAALAMILRQPAPSSETILTDELEDESKGRRVDYATPDESDELSDLLREQMNGKQPSVNSEEQPVFKPLQPEKLMSTQNRDPEELAKAIRHLTGE